MGWNLVSEGNDANPANMGMGNMGDMGNPIVLRAAQGSEGLAGVGGSVEVVGGGRWRERRERRAPHRARTETPRLPLRCPPP